MCGVCNHTHCFWIHSRFSPHSQYQFSQFSATASVSSTAYSNVEKRKWREFVDACICWILLLLILFWTEPKETELNPAVGSFFASGARAPFSLSLLYRLQPPHIRTHFVHLSVCAFLLSSRYISAAKSLVSSIHCRRMESRRLLFLRRASTSRSSSVWGKEQCDSGRLGRPPFCSTRHQHFSAWVQTHCTHTFSVLHMRSAIRCLLPAESAEAAFRLELASSFRCLQWHSSSNREEELAAATKKKTHLGPLAILLLLVACSVAGHLSIHRSLSSYFFLLFFSCRFFQQ